jgi:hypothetical protein
MDIDYFKSTGFRIKELKISTKDGTQLDIIQLYEELNIFDSIFQPCLSGNILIRDSNGLIHNLLLDGNEFLLVNVGKSDEDDNSIKKLFRIYKISDRQNINYNSETYILHFVSEEYIISTLSKVTKTYSGKTYSEMAKNLISDYLKVPKDKMKYSIVDPSLGTKRWDFPTVPPIEALMVLTKHAIDERTIPGFLFFENFFGYNFRSIGNLLAEKSVFNLNFNPKNLTSSTESSDFLGVRHFEVLQQFDTLKNIKGGVYGGKYKAFNFHTDQYMEFLFKFDSIGHPKNGENSAPSVGNIRTFDGTTLDSHYDASIQYGYTNLLSDKNKTIRETDPDAAQSRVDYENFVFQRKAIFSMLLSQRVKVVVPGNFLITSGNNVFLHVPKFSAGKIPGEDPWDRTLYGSYLIIASRHMIKPNGVYETIFEACTNSSNRSDTNTMYSRNDYFKEEYNGIS